MAVNYALYFPPGSADVAGLADHSARMLEEAAEGVRHGRVMLTGLADDAEDSSVLALLRASAVEDALVQRGVSRDRITSQASDRKLISDCGTKPEPANRAVLIEYY